MAFFYFLKTNLRWLIGGFLLTLFSSFGQTFFISMSAGEIRQEFDLTHGGFGVLYMIATLCSAMTLPTIGKIVDHISVSRTILLIMPALAVACILMSTASSVVILAVTIYLLRLFGQGMMTHVAMTAMGRWYSLQRGKAVSVAVVGHQAGEALFPIVFVSLLVFFGWRDIWMVSAIFLVLVAMPITFMLMKTERLPSKHEAQMVASAVRDWTRREVLRDGLFWVMCVGVLAPSFIGTTIFFHQIHLVELRAWEPEAFATAFVVMAFMTFVFALVSGGLIDRYSAVSLLPFFLLPLAAACLVLAFYHAVPSMFIFMALLGISYGFSSSLFGSLWPEIYGTRYLGSVRSVIVALMVFSTAMGPGLTGYLIDLGVDYSLQIAFMGVYCLAASALMLFVSRKLKMRNTAFANMTEAEA